MATEEQMKKIQEVFDRAYQKSMSESDIDKDISDSCDVDSHSETFNELKSYFSNLYQKDNSDSDTDGDTDCDVDVDSDGDIDRDCYRIPDAEPEKKRYEYEEEREM